MDRADSALTHKAKKLSRPAISNIAALTARGWGSARYALDLFKGAGMDCEATLAMDCISLEAVKKVQEMGNLQLRK